MIKYTFLIFIFHHIDIMIFDLHETYFSLYFLYFSNYLYFHFLGERVPIIIDHIFIFQFLSRAYYHIATCCSFSANCRRPFSCLSFTVAIRQNFSHAWFYFRHHYLYSIIDYYFFLFSSRHNFATAAKAVIRVTSLPFFIFLILTSPLPIFTIATRHWYWLFSFIDDDIIYDGRRHFQLISFEQEAISFTSFNTLFSQGLIFYF